MYAFKYFFKLFLFVCFDVFLFSDFCYTFFLDIFAFFVLFCLRRAKQVLDNKYNFVFACSVYFTRTRLR